MHIYCGFLVNIIVISEALHSQSTDHRPNGTHILLRGFWLSTSSVKIDVLFR